MRSFPDSEGAGVLLSTIQSIQDNAASLSELDGAIGDGDHGVNMNKGFTLCGERLKQKEFGLTEGLRVLGEVLVTEIGGAMGPLYGTLFGEMAGEAEGQSTIDVELFSRMLDRGTAAVMELGGARRGDKTMVDVLVPAADELRRSVRSGGDFSAALSVMATAAERGRDSTRDMVALVGRSSRLGERSRGILDAGAASCCLVLTAMAGSMSERLK